MMPYRSVIEEQSNDERSRLSSDLQPLNIQAILASPEVSHVLSPSIVFKLEHSLKTPSRLVTFDEMSPVTFAVSSDVQPSKVWQKPVAFSSIFHPLVSTDVRYEQPSKA